ncbi:MAG: helix-turn-helix transcriptional regulator [Proteobacteria bacterium]|nr:XRE family transcriptional regulator [Pseudomonadota bacterium]NOG60047.1 helix-turn-helix transcriptional regulator [Pseudomonadota bacterium]
MTKQIKYAADFERFARKVQKNIKRLRKEKGLSQEDLMDYDISLRTIQRIEQEKEPVNITLLTLKRLSKAFKIKTSDLLDV